MICSITCGGPEVTMVIRLTDLSSVISAHRQALDIIAARGEQAGDPGEDARLVVDDHRERVALGWLLP